MSTLPVSFEEDCALSNCVTFGNMGNGGAKQRRARRGRGERQADEGKAELETVGALGTGVCETVCASVRQSFALGLDRPRSRPWARWPQVQAQA